MPYSAFFLLNLYLQCLVTAAVSEPEASERGHSLIGRRTLSWKRNGLWSKAHGRLEPALFFIPLLVPETLDRLN